MNKDDLLRLLRPVALEDRPLFARHLAAHPPAVSELTFTNVFCWAEVRHHTAGEHDGHLLVAYRQGDCCLSFYPPVGPDPARIIRDRVEGMRDYCWTRLPRTVVESLGPGWSATPDRDNADYLYDLAGLRTLAGRAYHARRNQAHRFEETYHPEVVALSAAMAPACLHIQEGWLENQRDNVGARDESTALVKALRHFDELGLRGVGVLVEGALVAFAIGEPLGEATFVEHFEKSLPGYPGAYQFLLREFAKSIPDGFMLLNREQDMGSEGLRKAKESWHPVALVEKYALRVRGACPPRRQQVREPARTGQ